MRVDRKYVNMFIAMTVALRGTCCRALVGAVITKKGRVISSGYNGAEAGNEHCNSTTCKVDMPCQHAIHAEANALEFAKENNIDVMGAIVYCTHSPCLGCAKKMVSAGIKKVYYIWDYRDKSGEEYLTKNKVKTEKLELEGDAMKNLQLKAAEKLLHFDSKIGQYKDEPTEGSSIDA